MSYSLFCNDSDQKDISALMIYIHDYLELMGEKNVSINVGKCESILKGIKQDFPHHDGIEKASSFKKVANFVAYFVSERPIDFNFSAENFGDILVKIPNHENSIVALQVAIESLHGAKIEKDDGTTVELKQRISLSKHSYIDIINALRTVTPQTHFMLLSVFFEQLAYKANTSCQYNDILEI